MGVGLKTLFILLQVFSCARGKLLYQVITTSELAYKRCRKSSGRPPSHPDITPPDISEPECCREGQVFTLIICTAKGKSRILRCLLRAQGFCVFHTVTDTPWSSSFTPVALSSVHPQPGRDIRASSEAQFTPLTPQSPPSRAFLPYLCCSPAGAGSPTVFMSLKIITIFQNPYPVWHPGLPPLPAHSYNPCLRGFGLGSCTCQAWSGDSFCSDSTRIVCSAQFRGGDPGPILPVPGKIPCANANSLANEWEMIYRMTNPAASPCIAWAVSNVTTLSVLPVKPTFFSPAWWWTASCFNTTLH